VGGDGTVNEIGSALINTNKTLAIIPIGSGNGLARDLNIPLSVKKSTFNINNQNSRKIDTIKVNKKDCLNIAGVGFDAHIGDKFQNSKKRGFVSYVKLVLKEYFNYKPATFILDIEGNKIEQKAFLISNLFLFSIAYSWLLDFLLKPCTNQNTPLITKPKNSFYLMTVNILCI